MNFILLLIISMTPLISSLKAQPLVQKTKDTLAVKEMELGEVGAAIEEKTGEKITKTSKTLKEKTNNGNKTIIINNADKTRLPKKADQSIGKSNQVKLKKNNIKNPINLINTLFNNKKRNLKSIMLNDKESEGLTQAINAYKNNIPLLSQDAIPTDNTGDVVVKAAPSQEATSISKLQLTKYLNAILYISKNNWIVWVNGKKITSSQNNIDDELYIKSINSDKVNFVWTLGLSKWKAISQKQKLDEEIYHLNYSNQVEMYFTLRTNQYYHMSENTITEGKI